MRHDWRRYAAPAAFLLAATVAIVLVRSGMHAGGGKTTTSTTVPVLPRKHVVTATTKKTGHSKTSTATRQFWTVQAGDTYGVIATKSGVPVATLERLNPKISSTSLFIGEKIRLR